MADCGDYEEIPLFQDARGRLWGLRRNPPLSRCQRQLVGITQQSPSLKDAVGRLWVFEVGERSEVGALESSRNVNEVNHFREA